MKPKKIEYNIRALLNEWQKRLRLQDWDITVEWATHYHVEGFGRTRSNLSNRVATIQLVPPEQIQHECICGDPEVTLVHELIHVKAAETIDSDKNIGSAFQNNDSWECFIEHTAQALVAAKRGAVRIR